ncbi:uncharacterized protein LOC122037026 isoform X2 [Zingiber officinale]|uniref:uncharacterized protein LOC122037026 isoform X2 n=1 Tax=Zingiber officinale TaxID=94328 RepID=UPI001C4C0682|nr:uncharacterized protein LOC122037026 isoform X2 [Zingiber officinale]
MSREASVGGSGEASSNSGAATPSVASTTSGTSDSKRLAVNAPGNRSDPGWKHGIAVDENPKKVQCKYCQKVINGGIYRLKHHLAGTQKDVGACKAVSDDVRKEMWKIVSSLQENLIKRAKEIEGRSSDSSPLGQYEDEEVEGAKRQRREIAKNSADLFKKRGVSSQTTINGIFKKNLREEACQGIASFFYNNAIPFHVAKSDEFKKMLDLVARHGIGFKPPSYHEIRVKYLKQQVDCTKEVIEQHKAFWKKMGCTIMTDGWTDKRRRTILNFLVNSPMGTIFLKSIDASDISKTANKIFKLMDEIVEEVGEENVVQIVTDNAANYKAAGEMLMGKRKRLYWTPCAAHCIDLMLEDFEKKIPIHKETIARGKKITTYIYSKTALISLLHHFTKEKDLIRLATTRFATSYLTLGCLNDNKGALIRMFTSKEWKSSQFAKTKDGKVIENVVMDKDFWKSIITCLRSAYPLIKVLRLVDSDEKPAMGFIYEEMDRAKEKIQAAFNGIKKRSVRRPSQYQEKSNRTMILAPLVGIITSLMDAHSDSEHKDLNDVVGVFANMDCPATVCQCLLGYNWTAVLRGDASPSKLRKLEEFSSNLRSRTETIEHGVIGNYEEENCCCICYSCDSDSMFEPCHHMSCHGCITRHLLNGQRCFFCNAVVTNVVKLKPRLGSRGVGAEPWSANRDS